jgi:Zn finger protein HypA/HybF involved in hydrogenase expression
MSQYQCPSCKSKELKVQVTSFVSVNQNNGCVQTLEDFDIDWDDNAVMQCQSCFHEEEAVNFRTSD